MKHRRILVVSLSVLAIAVTLIISKYSGRDISTDDNPPKKLTTNVTTIKPSSESKSQLSTNSLEGVEPIKAKNIHDNLPEDIMNEVYYWQQKYPNMDIGVGVYSLDGLSGYQYNADMFINGACTIKAPYAMYVLTTCAEKHINIWSTMLTFEEKHDDPDGSGDITKYAYYGKQYSIGELIFLLIQVSDNVAYNMLIDVFPLEDFYYSNIEIDGENDWQKWGKASVVQRKNEWLSIYEYINSENAYSNVLRSSLTGTQYAFLLNKMEKSHTYMHKSGWCDSYSYPSAGDCAIVDDSYLLIVLTQDYTEGSGHIDCIEGIGHAVESYYYATQGNLF